VAPDRRRFYASEFAGSRKRRSDEAESQRVASTFAAAETSFRQYLELYELRPQVALKSMLEKSAELQGAAFYHSDPDLASAVSSLMGYLALTVERGELDHAVVESHLMAVRAVRVFCSGSPTWSRPMRPRQRFRRAHPPARWSKSKSSEAARSF
jgi:hypothetical protein